MRSLLVTLSICCITLSGVAQEDSIHHSPRGNFGWQLGGGIRQMDFTALRSTSYFLNQPPAVSGTIATSLFIGNPERLFLSVLVGTTINREKRGTYIGNNIRANCSTSEFGGLLSYQVYRNNSRKFLKAIYLSAGASYSITTISSQEKGKTSLNADTSFFLEYSHAKTILLKPEIMIELFNLSNKSYFPSFPLTLKLGYNFQVQQAKWNYYDHATIHPLQDRNVNLGGFYVTIGINFWLRKSEPASWFNADKSAN